jgi:hypothetical protein
MEEKWRKIFLIVANFIKKNSGSTKEGPGSKTNGCEEKILSQDVAYPHRGVILYAWPQENTNFHLLLYRVAQVQSIS